MTDEDRSITDDDQASEPNGGRPTGLLRSAARLATGLQGARRNGAGPAGQVRSGLAQRRNPALVALGDFAQGTRKLLFRDKLTSFLVFAAIASRWPSRCCWARSVRAAGALQIPISRVETLAKEKHNVALAMLLDHDNRVEIVTREPAGELLWACYVSSGAQTGQLLSTLREAARQRHRRPAVRQAASARSSSSS